MSDLVRTFWTIRLKDRPLLFRLFFSFGRKGCVYVLRSDRTDCTLWTLRWTKLKRAPLPEILKGKKKVLISKGTNVVVLSGERE